MGNIKSKMLNNTIINSVGEFIAVPDHEMLQLTNETTAGCKWFKALAVDNNEFVIQYYGIEIISDGDTGKFDKLTNGTTTDFNDNIVQTKVLGYRLGVFKGE